jgi:thioredoxin reductase
MNAILPVIIIGAGPGGISAAIQLRRYGLTPLLLEKDSLGGLLRNANLVENYPGFPNGIPGPKLVALFEKQMRRIGVQVTSGEVVELDYSDDRFIVTAALCHCEERSDDALPFGDDVSARARGLLRQGTARNDILQYESRYIIVASGTKPRPIPLEIPAQAKDRVSSEIWPLRNVRGKQIVIVGAGDAAFDYALNLASRENTVTILNRSREIQCLPLLRERAAANPNITYRDQTSIQRVESDAPTGRLSLITNRASRIASHESLLADYLLFAIGRQPAMDFLSKGVKLQAQRLLADGKLYLVGDVHNGRYRQTAIAVGEGLRAAMQIYEQLSLRGLVE